MTNGVEIIGADEVAEVLSKFAPRIANNLGRSLVHGIAGEISKEAKKRAPRRTGNLKKALKTKRRRGKPGKPVSDVIVTQGKSAKYDGFYWRFLEYGTQSISEQPFIRPAKDLIFSKLDEVVDRQFKKKLVQAVNRENKRRAKSK